MRPAWGNDTKGAAALATLRQILWPIVRDAGCARSASLRCSPADAKGAAALTVKRSPLTVVRRHDGLEGRQVPRVLEVVAAPVLVNVAVQQRFLLRLQTTQRASAAHNSPVTHRLRRVFRVLSLRPLERSLAGQVL